jgi:glycosyltransferase involved in cell wall biosynthesis
VNLRALGRSLRPPPPFFDAGWYRATNADVAASGMAPWRHWLLHGRVEGRPPAPLDAPLHDADLWRGFPAGARERLEALAAGPSPGDRALALWALARWHGARLEWQETAERLRALLREPGWEMLIPGLQPAILAARAFAHAGSQAERRAALRPIPRSPDRLLAAACAEGPVAVAGALSEGLGALGGVRLDLGGGAAFDRLEAGPAVSVDGPLVTVIVPARDCAATLPTALRSLCAQSWAALEILVVENGSSDDTEAVAAGHGDPRIRVLRSEEAGTYPARNLGLAEARGAFVTVHDADDWSHPRKIELQMAPMTGPGAPVATISHWLRVTPDLEPWVWRQDAGLVHRNMSSMLMRTDIRDRLGYWDRVRVGADTEFFYRLRAASGEDAVRDVRPGVPLALGRVTPGSHTQRRGTSFATLAWGVRRLYGEARERWHARTAPGGLHLPRRPARRPFDVPDAIAMGDPPAERTADDVLRRSALLDVRWYLETYEDVRRSEMDAALHYLADGAAGGRDPGPGFSTSGWAAAHGLDEENALLHYEAHGRPAGADPLPRIPGRLEEGPARVLVFGHQADATVFGAERSLLDMLDRLRAEGLSPVAVLPRTLNAGYREAVLARVQALHVVPYRWWRAGRAPHPVTLSALRRIVARERPREVHVNTVVVDAPLIAARAEGVPTVLHVRELIPGDPDLQEALGAGADAVRAHILGLADRFVANSPLVAAWIDAPERTTVRANAVDPALLDMPFRPGTPVRVAMVSSNLAKKGIADAVEIARRLPEVELRLIGPDTPDLDALEPLPANAVRAGYAEGAVEAMEQTDLLLSLSHFAESFGRVVLEAMAAGRPVVVYDGGHPAHLVPEGGGAVVPRGDVAAAADAVRRLVADPGAMAAAGARGRAAARPLVADR